MRRYILISCVLVAAAPVARADDQDAKKIAEEVLTKGASLFDARDAKALAATYTEDAVFTLFAKDGDNIKTEERKGTVEIEEFYKKLFDGQTSATTSKNHVETARLVGADVLIIQGHFQTDTSRDESFPFVQVRIKRGDKWLMKTLQLFALPK
jgi:ketosteroid isomerase-like protein